MTRRTLLARAAAALFAGLVPAAFRRKAVAKPAQQALSVVVPTSNITVRVPLTRGVGFPTALVWQFMSGVVNSTPLRWEPLSHCGVATVRFAGARSHEQWNDDGTLGERYIEYDLEFKPGGWNAHLDPAAWQYRLRDLNELPWDGAQIVGMEPGFREGYPITASQFNAMIERVEKLKSGNA